jgi:hypothetical protein
MPHRVGGRGRARRLGGEQRRDDVSARITHNRSLSVPSPPPQRRSHTRPPLAKGTSQCECIHVTHSHAEHMRESIWNRHWILQWGGYAANRAVINGATRVVNRVEAQCEWVWTAIWPPPPTPHTLSEWVVTLEEILLPTPIGVLFPPLRACVGTARWQQGKRAWSTLQVSLRGRGRRAQPLPHPPHTPHALLSALLTWCAKNSQSQKIMEAGISKHPQNIPQNKTL